MVIKNWEGYLSYGGTSWGAAGPTPHLTPQPGAPVPVRGIPIISACENQWGLHPIRQKPAGVPGILVEGPTHWLAPSQTHLLWGSVQKHQLEKSQRHMGSSELTNFRGKSKGTRVRTALSQNSSNGRLSCFFVERSLNQPTCSSGCQIWAIKVSNIVPPPPRFHETCPIQLVYPA